METAVVREFDGGITSDPRSTATNVGRIVKHFDILTSPGGLTPYRSMETETVNAATYQIENFVAAGTTLYGLGVVSGTAKAQVFSKTDFTDMTWATPANDQSSAGARATSVFVYYALTGKIYGLRAGTSVWSFRTDAGGWNDTDTSISYTTAAQGLVHSKDDILYIPYDNKIASNNNGSWNTAALTLPNYYVITSICELGNYLAIGCRPLDSGRNSRVFLWDRDSTVNTLSESIDWGPGSLYALDELEGELVGISISGNTSADARSRITFRSYQSGGTARPFKVLTSSAPDSGAILSQVKQKARDRMFFMLSQTLDGTYQRGIWSAGRSAPGKPLTVALDYLPNNDTAIAVGDVLNNFFIVNDILFASFTVGNNDVFAKSDDQANYTATSIWESAINPNMPVAHRILSKKLLAVGVSMEPLTAGQQVVLKYRVDGSAWSAAILTETTVGQVVSEAASLAGSSFTDGREFEFRVESTGGAVITALSYRYEEMKTPLNP